MSVLVHGCKLQSIATVIMMIETDWLTALKKKLFLKKSKDKKPYLNFFDRCMDKSDDKCSSAHNNDSEYFDKLYYMLKTTFDHYACIMLRAKY